MANFGNVISVVERPVGTSLNVAGTVGDTSLVVDDLSKLMWPNGALRIGSEVFLYAVDIAPDPATNVIDKDEGIEGFDEMGTVTLSGPLTGVYEIDEPVVQFNNTVVTERLATVILPGQAEGLIMRVPRHLWDRLPSNIRTRDGASESVALENVQGEWVMTDVVSEDPFVDASFINVATLPTTDSAFAGTGADSATFFDEAWTAPGNATGTSNAVYAHAIGTSVVHPPVATTTGFKYPTTVADDPSVGAQNWTATSAALGAPDDNGASSTAPSALHTHYLKLTNFGFAVPGGATITGVTVNVIRRNAAVGGSGSGPTVQDNLINIVKAGTAIGTDHSNLVHWPGDFTGIAYGGAGDLWGVALTPTDVNSSGFGVAISADMNSGAEPRIDAVRIKVNYTTVPTYARSDTHFLQATNFGFGIPDESVITGITAIINRKASDNSGDDYAIDNQIRLTNGTDASDDRGMTTHWPTVAKTAIYGGDLWGQQWTSDDINGGAFGILISADVNFGVTASVDSVQLKVSYVTAGDA